MWWPTGLFGVSPNEGRSYSSLLKPNRLTPASAWAGYLAPARQGAAAAVGVEEEMNPVHYNKEAFPPSNIDWPKLIPLIGETFAAVARYDGLLEALPNSSILLSPLASEEAVLSSKIEGTQTTIEELFRYDAQDKDPAATPQTKQEADIQEVINYRRALSYAASKLSEIPLSQRLIKEAHTILMSGVRGHDKAAGLYRRKANWIGRPGCNIEEATYVPISCADLSSSMDRWEKYIHEGELDKLVHLAVIHAEFEALHPFLDGNGRLGRMLIPLFMYSNNILKSPVFYISAYLEKNRSVYYEKLLHVSKNKDWTGWCMFFLTAIQSQANDNMKKVKTIMDLYAKMKQEFQAITHSMYASQAVDWMFGHPIFTSSYFAIKSGIPEETAKRILKCLKKTNMIKMLVKSQGRTPALMCFPSLLEIIEN